MDVNHAVDILVDPSGEQVVVLRRRDLACWSGGVDALRIGKAVKSALDPGHASTIPWSREDCYPEDIEGWKMVVVWRSDHRTIVATPQYSWGQAPQLSLPANPTDRTIGEAVMQQVRFISERSAAE